MRSPAVALRPARGRWRREERLELLWQLGADPLQLVARDRLAQRVDYRTRVIERFGAGYALQLRDLLEQLGQGERLLPAARWARQVALGTKRQLVGKICRQALREAAAEGRQGCGKRPFGASAVQPACGQRERSPELAVRCARAPDRGGALRPGRGSCSWRLMLESSAESSLIVCSSPGRARPGLAEAPVRSRSSASTIRTCLARSCRRERSRSAPIVALRWTLRGAAEAMDD